MIKPVGDVSPGWQLVVLSSDAVYSSPSKYFDLAYKAWWDTWAPVLQSVGVKEPLASDNFTRQYDRLAIFYEGKCAALTLFNRADLSLPHHQADSYFACWPQLAIQGLTREGNKILVCSAFTVTQDFRKKDFGFTVKDLLMGALVRYFIASPFDAMTGNMRNSKGMNDLSYRWGATPILKDLQVHGEGSDLVGFFKATVKTRANPALGDLLDSLWENRWIDDEAGTKRAA